MAVTVKAKDLFPANVRRAQDDYGLSQAQAHRILTYFSETLLVLSKVEDNLRRFHHEALNDAFVFVVLRCTQGRVEIPDVVTQKPCVTKDLLARVGHVPEVLPRAHRGGDVNIQ